MSTIKEIQGLISQGKTSKALKELAALLEKNELEDFTNPIIQLQSRQAQLEESKMSGLADSRDLDVERNKIINALNFFIGKIEDELPEEEIMSLDEAKQAEIDMLTKKVSHLTRKLEHLNGQLIIESNPSTKFDLEENIRQIEAEKNEARSKLNGLNA